MLSRSRRSRQSPRSSRCRPPNRLADRPRTSRGPAQEAPGHPAEGDRVSVLDVAAMLAAGFAAGTINTIVGSGALITFPTLLVLGDPPLTANVSNNIGLVPGGVSGSYGYRHELRGHARTIWRLGPLSF